MRRLAVESKRGPRETLTFFLDMKDDVPASCQEISVVQSGVYFSRLFSLSSACLVQKRRLVRRGGENVRKDVGVLVHIQFWTPVIFLNGCKKVNAFLFWGGAELKWLDVVSTADCCISAMLTWGMKARVEKHFTLPRKQFIRGKILSTGLTFLLCLCSTSHSFNAAQQRSDRH